LAGSSWKPDHPKPALALTQPCRPLRRCAIFSRFFCQSRQRPDPPGDLCALEPLQRREPAGPDCCSRVSQPAPSEHLAVLRLADLSARPGGRISADVTRPSRPAGLKTQGPSTALRSGWQNQVAGLPVHGPAWSLGSTPSLRKRPPRGAQEHPPYPGGGQSC
jgi:hypothetical protein